MVCFTDLGYEHPGEFTTLDDQEQRTLVAMARPEFQRLRFVTLLSIPHRWRPLRFRAETSAEQLPLFSRTFWLRVEISAQAGMAARSRRHVTLSPGAACFIGEKLAYGLERGCAKRQGKPARRTRFALGRLAYSSVGLFAAEIVRRRCPFLTRGVEFPRVRSPQSRMQRHSVSDSAAQGGLAVSPCPIEQFLQLCAESSSSGP